MQRLEPRDIRDLPHHLVRPWNAFSALGSEFGYSDLVAYLDVHAANLDDWLWMERLLRAMRAEAALFHQEQMKKRASAHKSTRHRRRR